MPKSKATKSKAVAAKKKLATIAPKAKKVSSRSKGRKAVSQASQNALAPATQEVASLSKETALAKVEKAPKRARVSKAGLASMESLSKMAQKWATLFRKASDEEVVPYSIAATYEAKTAIMHKVLGWGYILSNRNDRLEVLFKDGIKYLISNYKRD